MNDSDTIAANTGQNFKPEFKKVLENIETGRVDRNNEVATALDRFRTRDPEGYAVLRENIDQLSKELTQASLKGINMTRLTATQGRKSPAISAGNRKGRNGTMF